jgi:hypothetical protein
MTAKLIAHPVSHKFTKLLTQSTLLTLLETFIKSADDYVRSEKMMKFLRISENLLLFLLGHAVRSEINKSKNRFSGNNSRSYKLMRAL